MARNGCGEAIGQKIRLHGHALESTEIISCLEGLQFYRNEDRRILGRMRSQATVSQFFREARSSGGTFSPSFRKRASCVGSSSLSIGSEMVADVSKTAACGC